MNLLHYLNSVEMLYKRYQDNLTDSWEVLSNPSQATTLELDDIRLERPSIPPPPPPQAPITIDEDEILFPPRPPDFSPPDPSTLPLPSFILNKPPEPISLPKSTLPLDPPEERIPIPEGQQKVAKPTLYLRGKLEDERPRPIPTLKLTARSFPQQDPLDAAIDPTDKRNLFMKITDEPQAESLVKPEEKRYPNPNKTFREAAADSTFARDFIADLADRAVDKSRERKFKAQFGTPQISPEPKKPVKAKARKKVNIRPITDFFKDIKQTRLELERVNKETLERQEKETLSQVLNDIISTIEGQATPYTQPLTNQNASVPQSTITQEERLNDVKRRLEERRLEEQRKHTERITGSIYGVPRPDRKPSFLKPLGRLRYNIKDAVRTPRPPDPQITEQLLPTKRREDSGVRAGRPLLGRPQIDFTQEQQQELNELSKRYNDFVKKYRPLKVKIGRSLGTKKIKSNMEKYADDNPELVGEVGSDFAQVEEIYQRIKVLEARKKKSKKR